MNILQVQSWEAGMNSQSSTPNFKPVGDPLIGADFLPTLSIENNGGGGVVVENMPADVKADGHLVGLI